MPAHPKEILHDAVHGREALHVGGRLEAPHLPLALARRLMGDFGSIVRVLIRGVDHGRHHGPMSRRITCRGNGMAGGCYRYGDGPPMRILLEGATESD